MVSLFRRAFGGDPPSEPRHFVAIFREGIANRVVGYVHFSSFEPGIYLCGGLCVDSRTYRKLSGAQRAEVAARGSLSRWLLSESIAGLGAKEAVFAYTGDPRSRRDVMALGFVPTQSPYLLVQWHSSNLDARPSMVERVNALGPF